MAVPPHRQGRGSGDSRTIFTCRDAGARRYGARNERAEAPMRHLGSIVLSLLLAPIIYALAGIGLVKVSDVSSHLSTSDYKAVSIGLAALLGAGLAYALLVMARLSPLGPVLAGLGYLAVTGWFIGSRSSFTRVVHADALWVRGAALAPAGAVTAL